MKQVLQTERTIVARAEQAHAGLYFSLWTDPAVMANVGFPRGIPIELDEIASRIAGEPDSDFHRLLVVILRETGEPIGECYMHPPDGDGTASTDLKLLPAFQGKGLGTEVKTALLDFLFTGTDCDRVQATPNRGNRASIRMQEKTGGVLTGEGVSRFPDSMCEYTVPVNYFTYTVTRETWLGRKNIGKLDPGKK